MLKRSSNHETGRRNRDRTRPVGNHRRGKGGLTSPLFFDTIKTVKQHKSALLQTRLYKIIF